jgi:hypothetical protein
VGTLTRRASGSDGLNPQAIDKEPETRSLFVLSDDEKTLAEYRKFLSEKQVRISDKIRMGMWKGCVGDFDSFETILAIAAWQDELLTHYVKEGIKPYHVLGSYLYRKSIGGPTKDPKVALKAIRLKENKIAYADRAKNCWYGLIYGAQEFKISQTAGVPIEDVAEALKMMADECVGMSRGRQKVFDSLSCIVQEYEKGPFHWNEPQPLIANIQGWERDFSFEIGIIKILYELPGKLPRDWRQIPGKVVRKNGREQTIYGAVCSALFGAAKQMEARMKRQAGNCIMQSSGAMYCKSLEVRMWDELQPVGSHPWQVVPLNIHDEIVGSMRQKLTLAPVVKKALREYAKRVPLVAMDWQEGVSSWADKK